LRRFSTSKVNCLASFETGQSGVVGTSAVSVFPPGIAWLIAK